MMMASILLDNVISPNGESRTTNAAHANERYNKNNAIY